MKIDHVEGHEYWSVTHPDDLYAWRIIGVTNFKGDVVCLHVINACNPAEFRLLWCRTEHLEAWRKSLIDSAQNTTIIH